jgi:hypothetical protein
MMDAKEKRLLYLVRKYNPDYTIEQFYDMLYYQPISVFMYIKPTGSVKKGYPHLRKIDIPQNKDARKDADEMQKLLYSMKNVYPKVTMRVRGVPYEFSLSHGGWGWEVKNLKKGEELTFSPKDESDLALIFADRIRKAGRANLKKASIIKTRNLIIYWTPVRYPNMRFDVVFAKKSRNKKLNFVGYNVYWYSPFSKKMKSMNQYISPWAKANNVYVG